MKEREKEDQEGEGEDYTPFGDNLCNCFGLTTSGQVIWFDSTGSPFGVTLVGEGRELAQGRLLDLPVQKVLVIDEEEVYQYLVNNSATDPWSGSELDQHWVYGRKAGGRSWLPAFLLLGLTAFAFILGGATLLKLSQEQAGTADEVTNPPNPQKITAVASSGYNPISPPSISLATFTAFLREMNSPALTEATPMYQACLTEGGDPALALAFFEHESGGGKAGVAVYTHSIGNIRCSPGYACFTTAGNGSFRSYRSWTEGTRDWVKLLIYYREVRKLVTLEQIIPVYAPAPDHNNEAAYIAGVKKRVDDLRNREKG